MKIRIKKVVTMEEPVQILVDQDVDVCLEDVVAGFFAEMYERQSRQTENAVVSSGLIGQLNGLLDGITRVLSLIPDEDIRSLSSEMLSHHRRRLAAQAERFAP